jgi:hypothetical protein
LDPGEGQRFPVEHLDLEVQFFARENSWFSDAAVELHPYEREVAPKSCKTRCRKEKADEKNDGVLGVPSGKQENPHENGETRFIEEITGSLTRKFFWLLSRTGRSRQGHNLWSQHECIIVSRLQRSIERRHSSCQVKSLQEKPAGRGPVNLKAYVKNENTEEEIFSRFRAFVVSCETIMKILLIYPYFLESGSAVKK